MTIFSLPRTLVAGTPENVNHVQENFVALRDHINGNLDASNLATSADPTNLMGAYRTLSEVRSWYTDIIDAADVYILLEGSRVRPNGDEAFPGNEAPPALFHLDPLRYVVVGLTPKLRLFASMTTNNISPAINFTFSLRHVVLSGGDNPDVHSITLNGSEHVAGSDLTIAPGANSAGSFGASADFDVPAAGTYGFSLTTSTGVISGSAGSVWLGLMLRWA